MTRRLVRGAIGRALLVTIPCAAILYLGYAAFGLPFVPFDVFDWMARVLPGSLIRFGIDAMVAILALLGLNLRDTAKTAEQLQAVAGFLVTLGVVGTVFHVAMGARQAKAVLWWGIGVGLLVAVPLLGIVLSVYGTASVPEPIGAVWMLAVFAGWGAALGWLQMRAPAGAGEPGAAEPYAAQEPAGEVTGPASAGEVAPGGAAARAPMGPQSRRRFLVNVGGAAAAITVGGTALGAYLQSREGGGTVSTRPSVTLPNEGAVVEPVPGTRPEYTPLEDHYQIDINTTPPRIAEEDWRLRVHGLVNSPLELTLEDLKSRYSKAEEFVTLSCISNPIAGPLISTILWTGVPLAEVLDDAGVSEGAGYVQMRSEDGFYETLSLDLVRAEPRIMLVHSFDNGPLPSKHGFPIRIYIPNRYGMKQPKWITELEVTEEYREGYWVERGWSEEATVRATSVVDTVAVDNPVERGGTTYVPVGGIAYAGARGISAVEVKVDDGPWEPAEVREPLSELTWVIWRFEWPFEEGEHTFTVRCIDEDGNPQVAEESSNYPDGATGLHSQTESL